jgi:hypothetical protein
MSLIVAVVGGVLWATGTGLLVPVGAAMCITGSVVVAFQILAAMT